MILLGLGLVILGSLIQMSKIKFHKHFNNNDLFHLIELVALYFLYKGAVEFQDTFSF